MADHRDLMAMNAWGMCLEQRWEIRPLLFQESQRAGIFSVDFPEIPVLLCRVSGVKSPRIPGLSKPPGRLQFHGEFFSGTFRNAADEAELHRIPLLTPTLCCFPEGHLCILRR